jgi:hypothetical protein
MINTRINPMVPTIPEKSATLDAKFPRKKNIEVRRINKPIKTYAIGE